MEKSVAYDLKKNPEQYLNATLSMCREREKDAGTNAKKKINFLPTTTRVKLFAPYKLRVEARKRAVDRQDFNDWAAYPKSIGRRYCM